MLKFIQFLFFIGIYHTSLSQISLQEGPKTKRKINDKHIGFIHADSLHLYSVDNSALGNPVINCYDNENLDFLYEIKLSKTDTWSNFSLLSHVFYLNNSFYAVFIKKARDQSKEIFINKIRLNDQTETRIVLDTISPNELNADYEILTNEEENAFAFIKQNQLQTNSGAQSILIKAFIGENDARTQILEFPDHDKQYLFSNWKFSGNTEITFLAKHIVDLYKPNFESANAEENTFVLFNYNLQNEKLREIEISLHHRYISQIDFVQTKERTIVSGIYSTAKTLSPDGVFNLIFDADFNKKSHLLHDFSEKEISFFQSKRKSSNGGKITSPFKADFVNTFNLKNMVVLENGDFAILAEEFRKEWEENAANIAKGQAVSSSKIYFHQNILIFWFGKTGNLKSSYSIEKNQMSHAENDPKNAFQIGQYENDLFVFYNDHPKNIPSGSLHLKTMKSNKKKYLKCVLINEKNKKTVLSTASSSRKKGVIVSYGAQLENGNVYFNTSKPFFKRSILKFYFSN
jgi:hypothetical protein